MADDTSKTGRADDIRINVGQNWELAYWVKKFGEILKRKVSRKDLREAVKAVGPMAVNVLGYLREQW